MFDLFSVTPAYDSSPILQVSATAAMAGAAVMEPELDMSGGRREEGPLSMRSSVQAVVSRGHGHDVVFLANSPM